MKKPVSNFGTGRVEERVPLYKVVPLSVPFAIGIDVTDFCNFKCIYCWHSLTYTPPLSQATNDNVGRICQDDRQH